MAPLYQEDDPDGDYYDPTPAVADTACAECGSVTACGYDAEGRPMIHTTATDPDA